MDYLGEHIDNKFGGCDIPFGGHIAEIKTPEEQFAIMSKNFKPVIEVLTEAIQVIVPTINELAKTFARVYKDILSYYPNKRVVWLAIHGKKERTRKKNRKRIMKWLQGE